MKPSVMTLAARPHQNQLGPSATHGQTPSCHGRLSPAAFSIATLLTLAGASAQTPSFQGLGQIPGGGTGSFAYGVSFDGSVVVGSGNNPLGSEAMRWEGGVMTPLGVLEPSRHFSYASCITRDNATVFGGSQFLTECVNFPYLAISQTTGGGLLFAGVPPCGGGCCTSFISGCSDDGSVRAGSGLVVTNYRPLINRSNGAWQAFSLSAYNGPAAFRGISANGHVAVGAQWFGFAGEGGLLSPIFWIDGPGGGGVASLPQLHLQAEAEAASGDGSVIVGFEGQDQLTQAQAAIWTNFGNPVLLGDLPGGATYSRALAVTRDGLRVGGYGTTEAGAEAFLWDQAGGMRRFQDVLNDLGVSTVGWRLAEITGFSADGTVVVGNGVDPSGHTQAWRAIIPCFGPACGPACDPDTNQDGNVDQDDVSYLINVVGGGPNPTNIDPDFNHDGNVDQDDIGSLIDVVAGGLCP